MLLKYSNHVCVCVCVRERESERARAKIRSTKREKVPFDTDTHDGTVQSVRTLN